MNNIEIIFNELRRRGKKAFIAYITAGDPSIGLTEKFIFALERAGVDLIELGVPFSDPLADGPTIQRASERGLNNNINLAKIFRLVRRIRHRVKIPLLLMGYYNPIFRYGIRQFAKDAQAAGISGVIVPDLPPEEASELLKETKRRGLALVFLLAPTSTNKRIRVVCAKTSGFVYYVSLTGTTGEREALPGSLAKEVRRLRRFTKKPICVGFGISRPEQVRDICRFADGVIVGSAIIKVIEKNLRDKRVTDKVYNFVSNLTREAKYEK